MSTFHSLGRQIISESDVAPSISRLAGDQFAFTIAIDGILEQLLHDPAQSRSLAEFIAYRQAPYRSAFEFRSRAEYDDYVRSIELRTLSGDLVKSYEELVIANYLTEHGVVFSYERPYGVRTASRRHRQYQPDFYLPEYEIYIEHFALDREGNPPHGWAGYAEGVAWKREIHKQNGTRLIETVQLVPAGRGPAGETRGQPGGRRGQTGSTRCGATGAGTRQAEDLHPRQVDGHIPDAGQDCRPVGR